MTQNISLPTTEAEAKARLALIWNSEEPCGFIEIESELYERICNLLGVFEQDDAGPT